MSPPYLHSDRTRPPARREQDPAPADGVASGKPLTSSCLINNHNYGRFLCDAVDSALNQSVPYDEIIVVDDGSTDDSLEILHSRYGGRRGIRIASQDQSGQLSCIQRAVEMASGDLIFMLDSDDCQHPNLHAEVRNVYQNRRCIDFISVGHEKFGPRAKNHRRVKPTRDQGISALAAVYHRHWVGAPTSCLSMRSSLLEKVLPYPRESCWKTRADDVLVLGTSIMGAHKYHLGEPLVRYRLHDHNHFSGKKWSASEKMQYALKLNAMIGWYVDVAGYDLALLPKLNSKEFRTIDRPTFKELQMYLRLCRYPGTSLDVSCGNAISILRHYLAEKRRGWFTNATSAAKQDRPSDHRNSADTDISLPGSESRAA